MRKRTAKHRHYSRHAIRRLNERYGIKADISVLNGMRNMITRGDTVCVQNQTNTRKLHKLKWEDQTIFAIYNKSTNSIVTVLTPEQAKRTIEGHHTKFE